MFSNGHTVVKLCFYLNIENKGIILPLVSFYLDLLDLVVRHSDNETVVYRMKKYIATKKKFFYKYIQV